MDRLRGMVVCIAILLMGAPGASAQSPPPAPEDLMAEVLENGTVLLTWVAPAQDLDYNVYRNGTLLGTTDQTSYQDGNPSVFAEYFVRSVAGGVEGAASDSVLVFVMGGDDFDHWFPPPMFDPPGTTDFPAGDWLPSPTCPVVGVSIKPDAPPFVFVGVNEGCFPI